MRYFGDTPAFNVLLTTDSFVMKDVTYLRKITWEYLIVDEAHRYNLCAPESTLFFYLSSD